MGPSLLQWKVVGTLYLVATPIGNLEDITLRALRVLGEVSLVAAEDTRRTRKLLSHYGIKTPMVSYYEHNKLAREDQILSALRDGDVALVSDAGTPALSDPGYELVGAALRAGHRTCPIPGPSAPIAALAASGMGTDAFTFIGYLPRRAGERKRAIEEFADRQETIIAFEAPHRLRDTLADLVAILGDDRRIAICRELTKVHEQILRGSLKDVTANIGDTPAKGEITLVIAGTPQPSRWTQRQVREALESYLSQGESPSQASRQVARQSGWPRQEVYQLTMEE
jgi:16S rRNA (cytidine1402-2'-O)-methyltransferase